MLKYFFLLVFFYLSLPSFAQNNDIEILKKMNSDWIYSTLKNDTSVVSKIFAEDMIMITGSGKKMTRTDLLKNAANQNVEAVNIDSVDVRLLTNDVGIITSYLSFTVLEGGEKVMGKNCYQDVYVKRKNRWYAVAAHVTLLK
jgi:uncharacterized protein (TIGR02246 family)